MDNGVRQDFSPSLKASCVKDLSDGGQSTPLRKQLGLSVGSIFVQAANRLSLLQWVERRMPSLTILIPLWTLRGASKGGMNTLKGSSVKRGTFSYFVPTAIIVKGLKSEKRGRNTND